MTLDCGLDMVKVTYVQQQSQPHTDIFKQPKDLKTNESEKIKLMSRDCEI